MLREITETQQTQLSSEQLEYVVGGNSNGPANIFVQVKNPPAGNHIEMEELAVKYAGDSADVEYTLRVTDTL